VQELEEDQLWRYGVIDPDGDGNIMSVKKMVEKPEHGTAPSRFVSFGRYLYTPELFDALRTSDKSHSSKSEFTQTEAINHLAALGKVSAVQFEGTRYDLGDPLGFLTSAMQIGLQRSEFKETLLDEMRRLLKLHDNPNDENSA